MAGQLRAWAEGLWTLEGDPIRYLGFPYEIRMTIARLPGGGLWLHSPVQCSETARRVIDRLGPVTHLVTPNKLHHLFLADWAERYPDAEVHVPPGLAARRRDLSFTATLDDTPAPAWAAVLDQCVIGPSWFMDEVVFFHRPSRSLILGDLIENHDPRAFSGWQRRVAGFNRMIGPRAETPLNWRVTFYDRATARKAAQRLLAWRPERVLVVHGLCVEQDAEGFLRHGLAWLVNGTGDTQPLQLTQAKGFYDAFGSKQDWQAFYEDRAVQQLIDHSRLANAEAVFELGCGTGRLAGRLLEDQLPVTARYVGVDISSTMVSLARQRLVRFGQRARVIEGDGTENAALAAGSFDRFLSCYVLDLMADDSIAAAIAEARRLLAPGGLLCLVSLTHGQSRWSRFLERQWMRVWRRSPKLMGGCRPIELTDHVPEQHWTSLHHGRVAAFGLCSELLVARLGAN